jgi:hypothetical protein
MLWLMALTSLATADLALAKPSRPQQPTAVTTAAVLRRVTLSGGGDPSVRLELSASVAPVAKELPATAAAPARFYLDFPQTVIAPAVVRDIAGSGVIARLRVGQFTPDVTRVVVDLTGTGTLTTEARGGVVKVRVRQSKTVARPPVEPRRALPDAIDPLAAAEDRVGLITFYSTLDDAQLAGTDAAARATLARALAELGLLEDAARALGVEATTDAPPLRLARAELALAAGDVATARAIVRGFDGPPPAGTLAASLVAARVRVALAEGDLEAAGALTDAGRDPELAQRLARAALATAQRAAAAQSWARARAAYERVLAAEVDSALRDAAAVGLASVTLASDDHEAAREATAAMASSGDPLVRRAAAVLGTDAEEEVWP